MSTPTGHENTTKPVERLEIEDEEARQARIQSFLEKLNASSSHTNPLSSSSPPQFDFGNRMTYPVEPPTDLLSRVQAFLPQLEASNNDLAQKAKADPSSIDIEHISDDMEQYIEMNLGLGVFEDRSKRSANTGDDEDTEMSTSSKSSSEEDDDSDADSDSSAEIITSFVPSPRPIRPLPRRASSKQSPHIVVLEDKKSS
ncbi:hypothetical protein CVT24_002740 [Panaeolus cyanescens]|uniref:Uncharacterized protein n=1 Tax=Panaeolus cyanescens TaxID=181874 RepID=A0A409WJ92_9AGAR|nr:hypothetical protein CVT24_002740 [Panaeolus cyanescens]